MRFDHLRAIYLSFYIFLTGCAVTAPSSDSPVSGIQTQESTETRADQPPDVERLDQKSELDRALQRLVDDLELAVLGLSSIEEQNETGPGGTHVVQPGEYLDLIIEKTLPNSPIRENILRKAFVRLNPHAFGGNGNPNYLFARQRLKIPSVEDLREIIFKEDEMENIKQQSRDPSQGWISYP